jgi:hypothetical protein
MEPTLQQDLNPPSLNEYRPKPNPQPPNENLEIDARLKSLRTLIQYLRNNIDSLHLSLTTSLEIIVSSIVNAQG